MTDFKYGFRWYAPSTYTLNAIVHPRAKYNTDNSPSLFVNNGSTARPSRRERFKEKMRKSVICTRLYSQEYQDMNLYADLKRT